MSCVWCEAKEQKRNDEYFPIGEKQYVCRMCRQRWWSYNPAMMLWTTVDDDFTWDVITHNIDFVIEITKPARVMPGYEQFAIKPEHEVCAEQVYFPKLIAMKGPGNKPTAAIQWKGEWKPGNIFGHQFCFPLDFVLPDERWLDPAKIETFHIPFVGRAGNWPYQDREAVVARFGDENMPLAYVISDTLTYHGQQVCMSVPLVLLGDRNVGVIRPGFFSDDYFRMVAVEKFQGI